MNDIVSKSFDVGLHYLGRVTSRGHKDSRVVQVKCQGFVIKSSDCRAIANFARKDLRFEKMR